MSATLHAARRMAAEVFSHPEIARIEVLVEALTDNHAKTEHHFEMSNMPPLVARLRPEQVEWVVNDIAELGVKIGDQFFWLYKGRSLIYGDDQKSRDAGVALNEDTDPPTRHMWRPVFKREFGECCHPVNYEDPTKWGTVSLDDSDEWKPLPAA